MICKHHDPKAQLINDKCNHTGILHVLTFLSQFVILESISYPKIFLNLCQWTDNVQDKQQNVNEDLNLNKDSEENPDNVPNTEIIVKPDVDIDEDFYHYKLW